eukprot:3288003-Amphidinium_carterae.4
MTVSLCEELKKRQPDLSVTEMFLLAHKEAIDPNRLPKGAMPPRLYRHHDYDCAAHLVHQ